MQKARYFSVLAASLAAFLLAAPLPASATALKFTLDTSSLLGTVGQLAFDFLNYDPASNSVTVSNFLTDGTLGDASTIITEGDVTGTLSPGPVTLTDTDFFNEFRQAITLGNQLSFILTLTENAPSGSPLDSFSFFLLDQDTFPLFPTTDDPDPAVSGGTLFQVDINGLPSGDLRLFEAVNVNVTWSVEPVASIPLPSTALLIGAGLLGGLAARRRMR